MQPDPSFTRTVLFQAGGDSLYAIYRIPGVLATPSGTLLAYCEGRKTLRGDWGAIDILMRRSPDGGKSWFTPLKMNPDGLRVSKNPVAIAQNIAPEGEQTFNNPVAVPGRGPGRVHFLFCAEYARCFAMTSADDGQTWSAPVEITRAFDELREQYSWRVIAAGPGHGICLRGGAYAGRLVAPVWLATGEGGHAHRPSVAATIYSDDDGLSWHAGQIILRHGGVFANPSEAALVELDGGRVLINIRSEAAANRRIVSVSPDGASRWSPPRFDPALYEPVCCAGMARYEPSPAGADWLLFSNPASQAVHPAGQVGGRRENLSVRLSRDGGKTWPLSRVIDPGLAGYSDLAVGPDQTITCLYEGGGIGGNAYASSHISAAQFTLAWLEGAA